MSSHHHEDKKQRKLSQLLKNMRTLQINNAVSDNARSRDLEKEREEEILAGQLASSRRAEADKRANPEPVWSAKVQQLRNKNTGQMRDSKERWNRFAGTESGGGRGL